VSKDFEVAIEDSKNNTSFEKYLEELRATFEEVQRSSGLLKMHLDNNKNIRG